MSSTNGFQRVVHLFWDKNLENTDLENPIIVLGNKYKSCIPATEEELPIENNTSQALLDQTLLEKPLTEFKNYFQNLKFGNKKEVIPWPDDFVDDVHTRAWFTYRTNFPPLVRDEDGPSPLSLGNIIRGQNYDLRSEYFTTDCGWGCMIRTAQSLLANALLNNKLGRNWRFTKNELDKTHEEIISWFIDSPEYPFSIHNIVEKGKLLAGKKAGEWFGPSAAARSIQGICKDYDCGINVYIGSDSGDIYEQDLFKTFKTKENAFKPTLILMGVRLGVENINSIYWSSIKDILSFKESVGISGGRPASSHYFFGYQGDYLFYLDPHLPQPALKIKQPEDKTIRDNTEIIINLEINSVHTRKLRKIHLSEVDPSMLLGILIRTEDEWYKWKAKIQNVNNKNKIIHISPDHSPVDLYDKKPSFCLYTEDGHDFVDVGLEYDDLLEDETTSTPIDEESGHFESSVEEKKIQTKNSVDEELVLVLPEKIAEAKTQLIVIDTASEVSSSSFKEENYGNIDTLPAIKNGYSFDDSATVEVKSLKAEEPYVVGKADIASPKPVFLEEDGTEEEVESLREEDEDTKLIIINKQ